PKATAAPPRARIIRAQEARDQFAADRILDVARREAEALRAAAQKEFAAERARGFEEGQRAGAEAVAHLLAETAIKAESYRRPLQASLPDLVLDAAECLLGERDSIDAAIHATRHAISRQRRGARLILRVAPARVEAFRGNLSDLLDTTAVEVMIE